MLVDPLGIRPPLSRSATATASLAPDAGAVGPNLHAVRNEAKVGYLYVPVMSRDAVRAVAAEMIMRATKHKAPYQVVTRDSADAAVFNGLIDEVLDHHARHLAELEAERKDAPGVVRQAFVDARKRQLVDEVAAGRKPVIAAAQGRAPLGCLEPGKPKLYVVSHGLPERKALLFDKGDKRFVAMTPGAFAGRLRADGLPTARPDVRLLACHAGSKSAADGLSTADHVRTAMVAEGFDAPRVSAYPGDVSRLPDYPRGTYHRVVNVGKDKLDFVRGSTVRVTSR